MSDTSLFGTRHIVFIIISFVLMAGLYIFSRKLSIKQCAKILLYVGIVSEIIKIFYYIYANENKVYDPLTGATFNGVLPKSDLPFHLCSIQILFILVVNLTTNEKLRRFIFSFMIPSCLIGGIAAILIATDSSRSVPLISAQYFLYHIAISTFALRLLTDKEMKWRLPDMLNCFKFLLVIMFFAFYINSIVFDGMSNVNFMYVVGPPQDELPFLNKDHGWLVYITHYACLVVFAVVLCYMKAIIDTIKDKKQVQTVEKDEKAAVQDAESSTEDAVA
ncbi:MAG: YwaF family protein [Clostridia bacterium]|nr:YwaF family protein [Clostridia bacterium]